MISDVNRTWLYLDKLPKGEYIYLDDFKLKDKDKFIELVKNCIDFSYQCHFNSNYTKIFICDRL